eukprot:8199422-Pyramimonas_sp.AAC.1
MTLVLADRRIRCLVRRQLIHWRLQLIPYEDSALQVKLVKKHDKEWLQLAVRGKKTQVMQLVGYADKSNATQFLTSLGARYAKGEPKANLENAKR